MFSPLSIISAQSPRSWYADLGHPGLIGTLSVYRSIMNMTSIGMKWSTDLSMFKLFLKDAFPALSLRCWRLLTISPLYKPRRFTFR